MFVRGRARNTERRPPPRRTMTASTPSKFSPGDDSAIRSIIRQSPSPRAASPLQRMGLCKHPAGSTRAASSPFRSDAKIRSQMWLAGSKAGSGRAPGYRRRYNAQDHGPHSGRDSFGRFSLQSRRRPQPRRGGGNRFGDFSCGGSLWLVSCVFDAKLAGATPASRYDSFNGRVLLKHIIRSAAETANSVQPKSMLGRLAIWGFHRWEYTAIQYLTRKNPIFILMSLNAYILIAILTPSC